MVTTPPSLVMGSWGSIAFRVRAKCLGFTGGKKHGGDVGAHPPTCTSATQTSCMLFGLTCPENPKHLS